MQIQNVTIIGAGNVSWHLSQELIKAGIIITQIFSRDINKAESIAKIVNAQAINSLNDIDSESDLILLCVSDKAINEVVNKLSIEPKIIAHTAGSMSINALNKFKTHGVFYPLQTFTKGIDIDFSQTPLCIEANNRECESKLLTLAKLISKNTYKLNSEQRLQCHLAAVFANNFTNHMFHVAEHILKQKDISFDILKPIIRETSNKVQNSSPIKAQTGPAIRNDQTTINSHLNLLSDTEMEKMYSFVSQNIWKLKQQNS